MQHNQSPTAAAAPAPGSRSCCEQQVNDLDLAAYAQCRTQVYDDDEQHAYMQSKLFAANDVSLRTNYYSQNNCYLLPHKQILVHGTFEGRC
jgi:hypothetical protein